jgi:hypothetical protein
MSEPADDSPQSDEVRLTVVNVDDGAQWQACLGGYCVRSGSGTRLLEELRALLRSKGIEPPRQG